MIILKARYFLLCIAEENALDNGRELTSIECVTLLQNPNYVSNYSMRPMTQIIVFVFAFSFLSFTYPMSKLHM